MTAPELTLRERDVLELSAAGLNQQQIADELGIHITTVNQALARACAALGAHTRLHAVALAYVRGVLGRAVKS